MKSMHIRSKLILLSSILIYFILCNNSYSETDYSKTPVLFVHGSGLTSRTWAKMIKRFKDNGYPSEYLYAVDIYPRDNSNIKAAREYIQPAVEKLLQKANKADSRGVYKIIHSKIDIVSHSMGAVSSRWYCAKLHPERIRTWISIAGANHGTDALCQFTTPGSKEMCPAFAINKEQSKIQIYLNGSESKAVDETPFGIGRDRETIKRVPPDEKRKILYYTIRIEPDSWIKPERSAILDGCGGLRISISSNMQLKETKPGNFLFEKTISHDHLPKDKDMITFVAMLLSVQDK